MLDASLIAVYSGFILQTAASVPDIVPICQSVRGEESTMCLAALVGVGPR